MLARRLTSLAASACLLATLTGSPVLHAQPAAPEEPAILAGTLLDPNGRPLPKFRLILKNAQGDEVVSEPTDRKGRYSVTLPAGRYQVIGALAPDGTRLEVPELPPIDVASGVRRLDLRFRYASGAVSPSAARGRLPWWRIGAAAGATLVFSAAVLGDDEEPRASPFRP